MRKLERTIWFLILVEVLISAYLVYVDFYSHSDFCPFGGQCSAVKASIYGSLLGIKLSIFGLASFSALLLVFIFFNHHKHMPKIFVFANIIGAFFAAIFLYIQFFVLGKVCTFCLATDSIMLVLMPLSIWHYSKKDN